MPSPASRTVTATPATEHDVEYVALDVDEVLADWREVQRRIQEAPTGTPEVSWLLEESGRLRREYQSLVGQAVARFRANPTT